MATGGSHDSSSDQGLDLSEFNKELAVYDELNKLEDTEDSLNWEDHKAQAEFERIEAETSGELEFSGFRTPNTSPTGLSDDKHLAKFKCPIGFTQSAPNSPALSHESVQCCTQSAPTSPRRVQSNLTLKQKVESFEKLDQVKALGSALSLPRSSSSPKTSSRTKSTTRLARKKGLGSPLAQAGDFNRKRRRSSKVNKVLPPIPIITMSRANIPGAGRLNPRQRRDGGVGDTMQNLGFLDITTNDIPSAGKNVLRRFTPLRKEIVADANLVLTEANVMEGKLLLEGYLSEVVGCLDRFDKVIEGLTEDNPNAEAAIDEIVRVERELRNLIKYCDLQMLNRPAPSGIAANQDHVRLSRLDFPDFDGSGNYKSWKTVYDTLATHVNDEHTRKVHLLKALKGSAKCYVNSTMVPTSSCSEIIAMLEERYNDPMAINYNLLGRVFNSPELAKPQSTQAHWDNAVGDIMAIKESGLGLDEVLVYFRLHKFQPDIIRRVKNLHKITYPAKHSINLEEAMKLMNKITAEDSALTEDALAVERCFQNLTLTAITQIKPLSTGTPQAASGTSLLHTPVKQNGAGRQENSKTSVKSGGGGSTRGRGGYKSKSWYNPYCPLCNDLHGIGTCQVFLSAGAKRKKLLSLDYCPDCARPKHKESCNVSYICRVCSQGYHYDYLCPNVPSKGGTS